MSTTDAKMAAEVNPRPANNHKNAVDKNPISNSPFSCVFNIGNVTIVIPQIELISYYPGIILIKSTSGHTQEILNCTKQSYDQMVLQVEKYYKRLQPTPAIVLNTIPGLVSTAPPAVASNSVHNFSSNFENWFNSTYAPTSGIVQTYTPTSGVAQTYAPTSGVAQTYAPTSTSRNDSNIADLKRKNPSQ